MTDVICTCCPNGCILKVDEQNNYSVAGNKCPRGKQFGRSELLFPVRTVTSTVKLAGADLRMLPVKTASPVPKDKMAEIMKEISAITAHAPVRTGDVLLENAAGTGVSIVACRSVKAQKKNSDCM